MKDKIDYHLLKKLIAKRRSLVGTRLGRKRNEEEEKDFQEVQKKIQAIYFKETVELRADVLASGYQINSISEMVNTKEKYPEENI